MSVGGIWKVDIMVADIQELEKMDASELHARRLNAKEVLTPMKGDNFYFPGLRWNSQTVWRTRDDAEAKNDFWSITGDFISRHHVESRVKLYMPREESLPIPLKYIGVTRTTHTSLDVLLENILKITGT